MKLFKGHCYKTVSSYWATKGHGWFSLIYTCMAVVVNGCVLIRSLWTQSFLKKVSGIKANQFEYCVSDSVQHRSDSLAISLKVEQKYQETTQGLDLDFTRWWVVALTSRPALFFLLASFSILFHYSISQSPLPTDTCTHSVLPTLFPCSIGHSGLLCFALIGGEKKYLKA